MISSAGPVRPGGDSDLANDEELIQRRLLDGARLKGKAFGDFEEFDIGRTYVETLRRFGMDFMPPDAVEFPFKEWKPPRKPKRAMPDVVFAVRRGSSLVPVAVRESKGSTVVSGERAMRSAAEQALYGAAAVGCKIGIVTDGSRWRTSTCLRHWQKATSLSFRKRKNSTPGY